VQSSKPYKFKYTVGLSFLGGYFCCFYKCSNLKSFHQNSCFPSKTLLFTMHCRALYSTKYSWHANCESGDLKTFDPGIQWQLTKGNMLA